jgi:tripartite-type tricarboxylate transporter receptor subunit TctC
MVAGKLMRVLATFEPHSTMPGAEDATTLGLPDLADLVVERVVAAPPKLPAAMQTILSDALAGALADPSVIDLAQRFGSTLQTMSPKQTSELVMRQAAFFEKWKSLLEA